MFNLIGTYISTNKKFKVQQKRLEFRCSNDRTMTFLDKNQNVYNFFQEINDTHIRPLAHNMLIRLAVSHDVFDIPVCTNLIKKSEFKISEFLNEFDKVAQSRKKLPNNQIQANHRLKVSLFIVEPIQGGNEKKRRKIYNDINNVEMLTKTKNKILRLNSHDNLCLIKAILIGNNFSFSLQKYFLFSFDFLKAKL